MASKIYGDPEVIKAAQALPPGSPSNLVVWDAISNLPEMFAGFVTPVRHTLEDWEDVGNGNFMPSPDLVNRICEARGIFGCDGGTSEPIYQEIDWNRLVCKFDAPPHMVKMLVGYTAIKSGRVMMEDGSMRESDQCVVSYNAWERLCADAWGKEEAGTDFYSPEKIKTEQNGSRYYDTQWYDRTTRQTKTGKKYLKYDTRGKRQQSFDEELKFAQRKADTKSRNVVIRVITGMPTGYTEDQLKSGVFYFSRIQKSEFAIKAEQLAYLQRIGQVRIESPASSEVFGDEPMRDVTPSPGHGKSTAPISDVPVAPSNASKREIIIATVKNYKDNDLIVANRQGGADALLSWLEGTKEAEKDFETWDKTLRYLVGIESNIPEEMRIKRDF